MKNLKKSKKVISEQTILKKYLNKLNLNKKETFNYQNDAAFLKIPKNNKIVVTNDTIVESIDFFLNDTPKSIAHKILTYNLSDISSMGAIPYAYTLSLCLPETITKLWLDIFSRKLLQVQNKYNFFLLGGDISRSNQIIISSNFFGLIKKGRILTRTEAKINDNIWVSGNLGESSIGLAIRKNLFSLSLKDEKYFVNKYLFPKPCMIGSRLNMIATSAIDISDGFYGDLEYLLSKGKFGASIELNQIPFSKKLLKLINTNVIDVNYPLSSGDDYELIFTADESKTSFIKKISKINKVKITKIGKIIKTPGIYISGKKIYTKDKSYKHFF